MTPYPSSSQPPRRVLIIKPSALGDVVTAMPVLRGLRRTFPQCHITWMVRPDCAGLVQHDTDLNEILLFNRKLLGKAWQNPLALGALLKFLAHLRMARFDWVLDLQGLFRSAFFTGITRAPLRAGFADAREGAALFYTQRTRPAKPHTVDRNIDLAHDLAIDARSTDMTLQVSIDGRAFADEFCRNHFLQGRDYLVCVPPTTWQTKRYPVRHWRKVVSDLSKRMPVVLLGSPSPAETQLCLAVGDGAGARVFNLAGQTAVPQMVGLISRSAGVVCCDSSSKFIAAATGVDSLTLLGPTQAERTGPYLIGRAVTAPVPCRGCLKKRCRHHTCMELIDPQTVIAEAEKMLG